MAETTNTMQHTTANDERSRRIMQQAKSIMDNFFTALSNAHVQTSSIGVRRKAQTRTPNPQPADENYKHRFLMNAPNKDLDFVIAEKKQW